MRALLPLTFRPALLLSLAALTLLAGCQTMTPQERRAADERTCAGYGFRPNTDAMRAACLISISTAGRRRGPALPGRMR